MRPFAVLLLLVASGGLAADAPLRPDQLRGVMGLKPGSWRTTAHLVDMRIDTQSKDDAARGAEVTSAVRSKAEKSFSGDECLPESPAALFIPGFQLAEAGCEFSRVEAGEGRFAVSAICDRLDPPIRLEMDVAGTYDSKRVSSRVRSAATVKGDRVDLTLELKSRFIGRCKAVPAVVKRTPQGD
jgi:hypothetical protein